MTKSFVVVAAIFILVGGSIGGAFTGGVILGRNQAESEAPAAANFVPPRRLRWPEGRQSAIRRSDSSGRRRQPRLRRLAADGPGPGTRPADAPRTNPNRVRLRRRDSDSVAPASTDNGDNDDDAEATESADRQPGFAGFGRGLGLFGGGATFGTIDSIGEGVVVINTPQGPVEATISSETVIQVFSAGEVGDLEEGMSVTVMGQEDAESGKLEAASIIASPEGAGGFPGFGGFQNRPQGGGRGP